MTILAQLLEASTKLQLSPYNQDNGKAELLAVQIEQVLKDQDSEEYPETRLKFNDLQNVLATQAWLSSEGGGDPVVPGWNANPLIAKTPDGKLHLIDGHHRIDRALQAGRGETVWIVDVSGK